MGGQEHIPLFISVVSSPEVLLIAKVDLNVATSFFQSMAFLLRMNIMRKQLSYSNQLKVTFMFGSALFDHFIRSNTWHKLSNLHDLDRLIIHQTAFDSVTFISQELDLATAGHLTLT